MSLKVNLRHLQAHDARLAGELSVPELDIDTLDEVIRVDQPLHYQLEVQKIEDGLLVQGHLWLNVTCQCVRCLKSFQYRLELSGWTRHLALAGEEAVTVVNDCVDLTPYVREDILLELPQHPLCGSGCRGLPKPSAGRAKKHNRAEEAEPGGSPAWAELNKLKF